MQNPSRLLISSLLAVVFTASSPAQEEDSAPTREVVERTADELDDLLGPIALYPDDLVALVLPATTEPTDVVLAARYLDNNGPVENIGEQPWDESVRALAHFPDVIEWMNKNLSWTKQIGDAFTAQPADVMKSIQRLRARAFAAGTLKDTPQQRILVDGEVIRIVSAEEEVVYVPTYDPEVVFVDSGPRLYQEPCLSFGVGWYIGPWHRWECDWGWNRVWIFDNHDFWRERHRRFRPGFHFNPGRFDHDDHDRRGRAWCPPPIRVRHPFPNVHRPRSETPRPGRYVESNSRARYRPGADRPSRDFTAGDRRDHGNRNDANNDNNSRSRPPRSSASSGVVNSWVAPTPSSVAVVPNPSTNRDPSPDSTRRRDSGVPPRNIRVNGNQPAVSVVPDSSRTTVTPPPTPTTNGAPRREMDRRDYVQRSRTPPPANVTPAALRNVLPPTPAPAPNNANYNPPASRDSRPSEHRSAPPPTRSRDTSSDNARSSPPPAPPRYSPPPPSANNDQPKSQPASEQRSQGNSQRKGGGDDSSSRGGERSRNRGN